MRNILSIIFSILSLTMAAQTTQKGIVQEYNEKAKKTPLAGVELNVRSANSTVSDKNGAFTLTFPTLNAGARVKVRNAQKSGYEIFNKDALEQWNINPNVSFSIVMCRSDKFRAICDNYYSKASANYQKQLDKDKREINKLKTEGKLKDEEYNKRLNEIQENYEKQLDNLDNYIDRFARIDLSQLKAEEQEIIELVQQGLFDEAIAKYDALNLKEKYRQGLDQEKKEAQAIQKMLDTHQNTQLANKETFASIKRNVETLELAGGKENVDKAITLLREVAEIDSLNIELLIMAGEYIKNYLADYSSSMTYYTRALDISNRENGESHPLTCKANTRIGEVYIVSKEYSIAMEYFNRALENWELNGDMENDDIAELYNDLGVTLRSLGKNDKALDYYNKAIEIWKETKGPENLFVAVGYHNIGTLLTGTGQFNEALEYYSKATSMCEKLRGPNHPTVGYMYNSMGSISYYLGNIPQAIEYSNMAIEILKKSMTSDDPILAILYDNTGKYYTTIGKHDEGIDSYNKSLAIKIKKFGEENLNVALTYNHLGVAYDKMNDLENAEQYMNMALKIQEKLLPPIHDNLATTYANLGGVYSSKGEFEKAFEYLNKGLNIMVEVKGPDHPDVAAIYNIIAGTYNSNGNFKKALEYYNNVLSIKETKLGSDHPDIALCYNNIGNTYGKKGDYKKAMEYLEKSKSICEKANLSSDHPYYAAVTKNMSDLQELIDGIKKK